MGKYMGIKGIKRGPQRQTRRVNEAEWMGELCERERSEKPIDM